MQFQSTAHPKAGRNPRISTARLSWLSFNPRPTRRQAETSDRRAGPQLLQVSIHSPPEGRPKHIPYLLSSISTGWFQSTAHPKAGRNLEPSRAVSRFALFQSTAHPKAGRNVVQVVEHQLPVRFNPRPTRRQAETRPSRRPPWSTPFQSTAHPKAGRNIVAPWTGLSGIRVSIHGPPEGRPKHNHRPVTAPPRCFNPRPTRRQAETSGPDLHRGADAVSIHGPPEGRPKHRKPFPPVRLPCFNPRPTRRQAETPVFAAMLRRRLVSIHGPPEGRPKHPRSLPCGIQQPVSIHGPPEGRPKPPSSTALREAGRFNPRPTRRQAETRGPQGDHR